MIKNKSGYKWTSGDLDGIIIDGSIMPLRENKKILRGEDIAFLLESVCERKNAIKSASQSDYHESFLKVILAVQPARINDFIDSCFVANSRWTKYGAVWTTKLDSYNGSFVEAYSGNFIRAEDKVGGDLTFATGDKVDQTLIGHLFTNMSKLVSFYGMANDAVTHPTTWEITNIVKDETETSQYTPVTPQSGDIYKYSMDMWGNSRYWETDAFGSDEWKCTNGQIAIGENTLIERVTVIIPMVVQQETMEGGQENVNVFVNLGTKRMGTGGVVFTSDELVTGANEAMEVSGVRVIPYPGRSRGVDYYQTIHVKVSSSPWVISELGWRTRY